ncbi:hypothetical protein ACIBQ5_35770 [Streptomyces massasporeus]|uniref:hypothetical protein n=1 Tax=Streptomyces massasporeus TaxID=67324 RepID=UPI00379798BE
MKTETRNRVAHTIPLRTARAGLLALGLVRAAVPAVAAVAAARVVETQLADHVHGLGRVAFLVLAAVVALFAIDSAVTELTERPYRRAYGRVHGPRSWSCEDCGREITARQWTPSDAAVFEAHLADPAAHHCNP